MLGYVIALMVAWPIVGYAAIVIGAAYWVIRGVMIFGIDPVKLNEFVGMFGSKGDCMKSTLKDGWRIEVAAKPGTSKKEIWKNRLNNLIKWPVLMYYLHKKGKAACEHFKSEV